MMSQRFRHEMVVPHDHTPGTRWHEVQSKVVKYPTHTTANEKDSNFSSLSSSRGSALSTTKNLYKTPSRSASSALAATGEYNVLTAPLLKGGEGNR